MLTAIAIPVFTTQLEKSREATDLANLRSAYAAMVTQYLTDTTTDHTVDVPAKQAVFNEWKTDPHTFGTTIGSYAKEVVVEAPKSAAGWTVKIAKDTGDLTITAK